MAGVVSRLELSEWGSKPKPPIILSSESQASDEGIQVEHLLPFVVIDGLSAALDGFALVVEAQVCELAGCDLTVHCPDIAERLALAHLLEFVRPLAKCWFGGFVV